MTEKKRQKICAKIYAALVEVPRKLSITSHFIDDLRMRNVCLLKRRQEEGHYQQKLQKMSKSRDWSKKTHNFLCSTSLESSGSIAKQSVKFWRPIWRWRNFVQFGFPTPLQSMTRSSVSELRRVFWRNWKNWEIQQSVSTRSRMKRGFLISLIHRGKKRRLGWRKMRKDQCFQDYRWRTKRLFWWWHLPQKKQRISLEGTVKDETWRQTIRQYPEKNRWQVAHAENWPHQFVIDCCIAYPSCHPRGNTLAPSKKNLISSVSFLFTIKGKCVVSLVWISSLCFSFFAGYQSFSKNCSHFYWF